jgi:hypothetical protein
VDLTGANLEDVRCTEASDALLIALTQAIDEAEPIV